MAEIFKATAVDPNFPRDYHPKGYVPLWKQWMNSDEFFEYKRTVLPSVLEQMKAHDNLDAKEREELMAKEFQVRWVDAGSGKVQQTAHKSEKAAKDKARDLSLSNSPVQVGEIDDGSLTQQWSFDKGRQQAMDTKKQVSIAPISKKEASTIKSNTNEGTKEMATKSKKSATQGKNGHAGKAQKAGGASKVAAKAKTQSPAGSGPASGAKKGGIREQFGLREGTNREKLVDALLAAKGKAQTVSQLLKATYGNAKEENKGALMMVMKGVQIMIDKNKIKLSLIKGKTEDKEMTFALKAK